MVKIEWYSGGRAQETPLRLVIDGEPIEVDEVIERALAFDTGSKGYRRLVRVRCGNRFFRLVEEWGEWDCHEE